MIYQCTHNTCLLKEKWGYLNMQNNPIYKMKKNKKDPLNTSIKHVNAKIHDFFINNIYFFYKTTLLTLFFYPIIEPTHLHFKPIFDFHLHGLCLENHGTMVLFAANQLFCKLTTNTPCMAATPTLISIDLWI